MSVLNAKMVTLGSDERIRANQLRRRSGTREARLSAPHLSDSEWYETDTGDWWLDDGADWIFDRATAWAEFEGAAAASGSASALTQLGESTPSICTLTGSSTKVRIDLPGRYDVKVRGRAAVGALSSFGILFDGGAIPLDGGGTGYASGCWTATASFRVLNVSSPREVEFVAVTDGGGWFIDDIDLRRVRAIA